MLAKKTAFLLAVILTASGLGATAAPSSADAATCAAVTSIAPVPSTDGPFGITEGPGGTWYADGDLIVRIQPDGTTNSYALPSPGISDAGWLTWPGGRVIWFSDRGTGALGRIDASGQVVEYPLPAGPDGTVGAGGIAVAGHEIWLTDSASNRLERFDTRTQQFSVYPVPTADSWPLGITFGPDGALWFIERSAGQLGRMTTHGVFTEWALAPDAFPNRIVVGPDRAIWFTELDAGLIGRMSMRGQLTQTPIDGGPVGITVGPDHHLYTALWNTHQLARLDPTGHIVRTWEVPGALLVAADQHALWLTDPFADTVAQVRPHCRA